MIWNSNFDRDFNNAGRGVENNFKEKVNGDGLQPLFKSNKLTADVSTENTYSNINQNQQEKPQKSLSENPKSSVF